MKRDRYEDTRESEADDIFHPGERMIQRRYGHLDKNLQLAERHLYQSLPTQHIEFYAQLPWLCIAWLDDAGWPRLSLVSGSPGFAWSPNPRALDIAIPPQYPLRRELPEGTPVGILGIELDSRRRNRLHGLAEWRGGSLRVHLKQAYGNCPKYIHARQLTPSSAQPVVHPPAATLDSAAHNIIAAAETFFIASAYIGRDDADSTGADASHRGGRPGFVRAVGDDLIQFVDYPGNRLFNTLGNLVRNPACTLAFVDFANGTLLEVQGHATVHFAHELLDELPSAERLVEVKVRQCRRIDNGFPFRGDAGEPARGSLAAGILG